MEARFACGSMVRFLSFSHKCGSQSHICVKKEVQFRPAGGEMSFRVRDRVTGTCFNIARSVVLRYTTPVDLISAMEEIEI